MCCVISHKNGCVTHTSEEALNRASFINREKQRPWCALAFGTVHVQVEKFERNMKTDGPANYVCKLIRCLQSVISFQKQQQSHCTYNLTVGSRARKHCCRGKAVSITYLCLYVVVCSYVCMYVCVHGRACSLTYPACNAPPILSSATYLTPHFLTLSHKRHDFRKKVTEQKTCVLIFSTTFI